MEYKASTDMMVKFITAAIALLFAYMIYDQLRSYPEVPFQSRPTSFYGAIVLGIAFIAGLALSTRRYIVNTDSLVIVTPFYNKTLLKQDFLRVDMVNRKDLGFMIRLFGNGGLFGYFGWYRAANLGNFFFYGTQMKNLILIQMKTGRKYIITPDDTSILSELQPK